MKMFVDGPLLLFHDRETSALQYTEVGQQFVLGYLVLVGEYEVVFNFPRFQLSHDRSHFMSSIKRVKLKADPLGSESHQTRRTHSI